MVVVAIRTPDQIETGYTPDGREGRVDPDSGGLWVTNDDGSMSLLAEEEWNPAKAVGENGHYDNLVDILDPSEVARLADEVWRGVTADVQSRAEYMEMTAQSIRMLGLRIDPPRSDAGGSGAPLEGMSTVRHPLLLEACLGFQSDFRGEMLPAGGPCKVRNDHTSATVSETVAKFVVDTLVAGGMLSQEAAEAAVQATQVPQEDNPPPASDSDDIAEAFEADFNHYLTVTATEYIPDTDSASFNIGLTGCIFKKVYNCPIRERPVSESISPKDLIVDAGATDIANAPRVTHQIEMLAHEILQLQEAGVYAHFDIGQATMRIDPIAQAEAETQGYDRNAQRPEDRPHTIWECYTRANIRGLDDSGNGKFKVPRPYKISIDRDTHKVYEIRRNWAEDDKKFKPRRVFVKYPFVPALGFYDIGLMHILGNTTMALTASWRLNLDAMMFSNFPGFLYSDVLGKQLTNIFRVPPGGGVPIQTGGKSLAETVQPLPYKGPQPTGLALVQDIAQTAAKVGNRPNVPTGEGQSNVPVGTILASIIESTKLVGAVFKRLHAAQAEEFGLFKERFREDPEAFWRHNLKPARKWAETEFLAALNDVDIVPAADPNTPSHLHRVMQRLAVFQFAQAAPTVFKIRDTAEWLLRGIGVANPAGLLKTEQQMQQEAQAAQASAGHTQDPGLVAAAQTKAQAATMTAQAAMAKAQSSAALSQAEAQKATAESQNVGNDMKLRAHEAIMESQDRAADRHAQLAIDTTREETARLRLQHEQAAHHDNHSLAAAGLAGKADNNPAPPPNAQE